MKKKELLQNVTGEQALEVLRNLFEENGTNISNLEDIVNKLKKEELQRQEECLETKTLVEHWNMTWGKYEEDLEKEEYLRSQLIDKLTKVILNRQG